MNLHYYYYLHFFIHFPTTTIYQDKNHYFLQEYL